MNKDGSKFEGLLDEYFESSLAAHPIAANYAGLRDGEGQLGRSDLRHEQQWERHRQKTLAALDTISPRQLSHEQQLDRLALRSELLGECEDFTQGNHALDPVALDTVLGVLLHELQRGEDEPKRAGTNLRSLLRHTPRHLEEAAPLIDRPERVWRHIMVQTAESAGSLFDAVDTFLKKFASPNEIKRDAALIASARRAFTKYHDAVRARRLAPEGSFAIGSEATQRRVRDELGLDYSLGEIESLALAEAERINLLLAAACAPFGRKAKPEQIIEEARQAWNPGPDLLGVYRTETTRVAQAFKAARVSMSVMLTASPARTRKRTKADFLP